MFVDFDEGVDVLGRIGQFRVAYVIGCLELGALHVNLEISQTALHCVPMLSP